MNLHLPHTQLQIDATNFGKIGDGTMRRCASRGTAPPSSPPPLHSLENGVRSRATPPVHYVARMVSSGGGAERKQHECLAWLYAQPEGSVVLLCFGSMGTFRGGSSKRSPSGWKIQGEVVMLAGASTDPDPTTTAIRSTSEGDLLQLLNLIMDASRRTGRSLELQLATHATPHTRRSAWGHAALMDCLGAQHGGEGRRGGYRSGGSE